MSFLLFKVLKENNQPIIINGPATNALKSALTNLLGLGAPVERNDIGFNQMDFPRARSIAMSAEFQNDGLTLITIRTLLGLLNNYKNTQLKNYKQLKDAVEREVAQQMPETQTSREEGDIVTVFRNEVSYGKTKVQLSELGNNHLKGLINKVIFKKLEADGATQEYDEYGKLTYSWKDKLKYYNKDKTDPFITWVHPTILPEVLEVYKNKNYKINFVGEEKPTSAVEEAPKKAALKASVVGLENSPWGEQLKFTVNAGWDEWTPVKDELDKQGLWKKSIGFSGKDNQGKAIYALNVNKGGIDDVLNIFIQKKIDVSEITDFIKKNHLGEPKGEPEEKSDQVIFVDVPGSNKIKMKFKKFMEPNEFQHIKEMIVYTFPEAHEFDTAGRLWKIGGEYQQFVLLGRLLKDYNYNVDDLRNIIKEKVKRKELIKDRIEGDVPSAQWNVVEKATDDLVKSFGDEESAKAFLNSMPDKQNYRIDHLPHFQDMINELLPNKSPDIEFYDAQKEGIEFLFHRNRAILGDETGLGKTVQLISAAEIKMQETDYQKPTLILAINDVTVKQWQEEVLKIIGRESADLVSTDCNDPKRWTILNYNLFSHKKIGMESIDKNHFLVQNYRTKKGIKFDTEEEANKYIATLPEDQRKLYKIKYLEKNDGCIKKLTDAKFGIAILDELHKVKSDKTARWQKLTRVIGEIPVRWGATATISANDAMDVKNQLLIVNHHLGKLPDGKFKKDFAGMELKDTPVGPRYAKGSEESRLAAAERLNKWLHLTGVYMRRKKSDIRDMPNLDVGRADVGIDEASYEKKVRERLDKYDATAREKGKDLSLAEHLKAMIAQRTELATAKVPETIKLATKLLQQGKRIIIFTAFKESAELLKAQLAKIVPSINPNYKMLTYISSTPRKERAVVKKTFNTQEQYRVLLMSLRMGSTGIDFPNAASEMIINDYDWTPEQAEQSEGRIYRINTNQNVNIHYVIAKGTYDEQLYDIVQIKRKVAQEIQKTREEYRKEKNLGQAEVILKHIVDLQKQLIAADEKIKDIEEKEISKTAPTGAKSSFKEFIQWRS